MNKQYEISRTGLKHLLRQRLAAKLEFLLVEDPANFPHKQVRALISSVRGVDFILEAPDPSSAKSTFTTYGYANLGKIIQNPNGVTLIRPNGKPLVNLLYAELAKPNLSSHTVDDISAVTAIGGVAVVLDLLRIVGRRHRNFPVLLQRLHSNRDTCANPDRWIITTNPRDELYGRNGWEVNDAEMTQMAAFIQSTRWTLAEAIAALRTLPEESEE